MMKTEHNFLQQLSKAANRNEHNPGWSNWPIYREAHVCKCKPVCVTMRRAKKARVFWPCRVCLHECDTNENCICCDGCQTWLHSSCIAMAPQMLVEFAESKQGTFYCAECALDTQRRSVHTVFILLQQQPKPINGN